MGQRSHFKGRRHSEETRARISLAKRGRVLTDEHKAKIAASLRGKPGRPIAPEHLAKMCAAASAAMRGVPKSEAHKQAHSKAAKASAKFQAACAANRLKAHAACAGRPLSAEHKAKQSAAMKGRVLSAEMRAKLSVAARNRPPRTAEYKTAMSLALKTSEKASRQRARIYLANPSSIELAVQSVLDAIGVAYAPQHRIGRYVADFYVESLALVIECDGSYWHRDRTARDDKRDTFMRSMGLRVLRLPEAEIRSGRSKSVLHEVFGRAS